MSKVQRQECGGRKNPSRICTYVLAGIILTSIAAWIAGPALAEDSLGTGSAVDVVFVLDNSGSMRQNDPEFLTRTAVTNFASALAADPEMNGRIAIVLFDGRARLVQPLTPVAEEDADRLLGLPLSTLDFSGQRTNSPSGIERALYELREHGREDAKKAVILLTDGKIDTGSRQSDAEAGRWLREDLAEESRGAGIRIFGIAFTDAADYKLMQELALKTQASYYRAFQAIELGPVVSDVLGKLAGETGESLAAGPSDAPSEVNTPAPDGTLPNVAAAANHGEADESSPGLLGWLPVVILLVAGSLFWRAYRGNSASSDTSQRAPYVDADAKAPRAQLLDPHGHLGSVGGIVPLGDGRTTIGRDPHNDIVFDNDVISSEHAVIEVRQGRYWLEDRRSTNETRVGNRRLEVDEPAQLKGGDRIRFGNLEVMFALEGYVPVGETLYLNPSTTGSHGLKAPSPAFDSSASPSEAKTDADFGSAEKRDAPERQIEGSEPPVAQSQIATDIVSDSEPPDRLAAYRGCLDFHLDRVTELSPALAAFVARGFDDEMRNALSMAAAESIESAQQNDSIEQKTYTVDAIRYLICAMPDTIENARARFGDRYGGFTRLLTGALQDESFHRERCEILAVLTYGMAPDGAEPWVSLSIVPDEGQDPRIDLLSYEFLTDEERHEIAGPETSDSNHSNHA